MATIIDFSPTADETGVLAAANASLGTAAASGSANIAPLPVPAALASDLTSDHDASTIFATQAPDILFIAEYAPTGTVAGILVVFENFYGATHYEVFRSNLFAKDSSFDRILFLDAVTLAAETAKFSSYITDFLKLPMSPGSFYAILDTDLPSDRIYQYQIAAGYYPRGADIDFGPILQSKGLANVIALTDPADTVFDLSQKIFGDANYAWIIALCNNEVEFFGRNASVLALPPVVTRQGTIIVPKDVNNVVEMIQESIYFFGIIPTLNNLMNRTRNVNELPAYFDEIQTAVNVKSQTFSYATLQSNLVNVFPQYKRLTDVVTSPPLNLGGQAEIDLNKFLSNIPVKIPNYTDTTGFNTFADLTLMFLRLNSILITALYAFDNDTKVKQWFPF